MKFLSSLFVMFCSLLTVSCATAPPTPGPNPPPPIPPILQPIAAGLCAVENTGVSVLANTLNQQCGAPVAQATQCIQSRIGNLNICALAGVSGISAQALKDAQIRYQTALKSGHPPMKGPIGSLVCMALDKFALGLFTQAIPSDCGCTHDMSGGVVDQTATAICSVAIPI